MLDVGIEFDSGSLEELGMNDKDETMVKSANILSDNGAIQKNKEYRLTDINTLVNNKGVERY